MKSVLNIEPVHPKRPGTNSLRPGDIKRYGVERFMKERESLGPFQIPPMHFSDEENRRMDEILAQEKAFKANGF